MIGSVGSATLLYGLALIYGATGATDFSAIADALAQQEHPGRSRCCSPASALVVVGLGFKASVAPFHQWTPDVYEGAPTPITAFMAVATKAAALGVTLRLLDVALIDAQLDWAPALAALAAVTIVVGNVGAIWVSPRSSACWPTRASRRRATSSSGVVVGTRLGLQATVFYLAVYLADEPGRLRGHRAASERPSLGDDISAVTGLGATARGWPGR